MPPSPQELLRRYRQLRHILERAYAQPAWNSERIDRIANALSEAERALCRFSHAWSVRGTAWRSAQALERQGVASQPTSTPPADASFA